MGQVSELQVGDAYWLRGDLCARSVYFISRGYRGTVCAALLVALKT